MARLEFNQREFTIGCLMQATIGTAQAASANFQKLRYDTATYDPDNKIFKIVTANNQRMPIQGDWFADAQMPVPKLTLSGTISKWELANFMMLNMQTCTEAVGTPFVKNYTVMTPCKAFTTGQSVGATEGYVATFALYSAITGEGFSFKDAVCTKLTLKGDRMGTGLDALMKYDAEFLGFTPLDDQTFTNFATWVAQDTTFIPVNPSVIVLNDGSNNITWRQVEVTMDQMVKATPGNSAWMFGDAICTMKPTVNYNSLSQNYGSDFTDKTAFTFYFGTTSAVDATGEFRATIKGHITKFPPKITSPEFDFEIEGAESALAQNNGYIFDYADGVDRNF